MSNDRKLERKRSDIDVADVLLSLSGIKRQELEHDGIPEATDLEKNKRQRLIISDSKGISLKMILNSPGSPSPQIPISFRNESTESSTSYDIDGKEKNREIIKSFWMEFFPELPALNDENLVQDDDLWKNTLNLFLSMASTKHIKQLIMVFILKKIRVRIPDVTQIPWKVISDCGIVGWPEHVEIENVWGMNINSIDQVVAKLDTMELTSHFVEEYEKRRSKSSHYQNLQKSICYHIRDVLNKQVGISISNIPWRDLSYEDFINWPSDVPVGYPVNMTIPQKIKLNECIKDIRLKDEGIQRIRLALASSEIHLLRKEIISTLRTKLNEQLGQQVANVPWKSLKRSDILNWPETVPVEYPNLLSSAQNKLIIDNLNKIEFTQEFLDKMLISISSNRHYQGKTSSSLAKDLRDKLNSQLNSTVSGISWLDLKHEDIIGWPKDIPIKHPHKLNAVEKQIIREKVGEIEFSQEFLQRISSKKVCVDIRKFVSNELRSKLANQLKRPVGHIPWKEMKLEDISGWPTDVPILYPNLLSSAQNKMIMDSMPNITFTEAFVKKCQRKHKSF